MEEGYHEALPLARHQSLQARRDGPGVIRVLALVLAASAGSGAVVASWGSAWVVPAVLLGGVAAVGTFPAMHESGHRTAFATRWLNDTVWWVSSFWQLSVPAVFTDFHSHHHRYTQDLKRDPEINLAPGLLAGWPPLWFAIMQWTGLPLMFGRLYWMVVAAIGADALTERAVPFLRPSRRRVAAWQARGLLAVHASVLAACTVIPQLLGVYGVIWSSHAVLAAYILAEHTGLPSEGTLLERTRTMDTHPLVHWWMWNMTHHAEHHGWPAVPFHALPAVRRHVEGALVQRERGYLRLNAGALRRSVEQSAHQ